MRDIIFRGKLIADGSWSYGNLVVKPIDISIITPDDTPLGKYGQVIPETIGQYTGLTDKKGKKIFEGDILENEEGSIYSASYSNEVVFRKGLFFADGILEFLPNDFELCEVIGNIHDNPELLGVGK